MEIIKHANTQRIKKCHNCKTVFVYDLVKDVWHCWKDFVICPICKENNNISKFDRKYKGGYTYENNRQANKKIRI